MTDESGTNDFEEAVRLVIGTGAAIRVAHLAKRGRTCSRKGRHDEAATAYQGLIEAYKVAGSQFGIADVAAPSWAFYKLGLALEKVPDLPKATEALEQAITGDPGKLEARMALARVAVERSDYDRALDEYKKAGSFIQENRGKYGPAGADKKACEVLAHLSSLLICMERRVEAKTVLEHAISLYPDNPRVLANYAIIAGERGDLFDLRKYLGMALEKAQRGRDDDLINELLQNAPNADFGGIVLEMLSKHRQIIYSAFLSQQRAWLQRHDALQGKATSYNFHSEGVNVMPGGTTIQNHHSSIGFQGDHPTNIGVGLQVNQVPPELSFNMEELIAELDQLISRMSLEATGHPERYFAIGEIEHAKVAAKNSDREGLRNHLIAAGQWALQVATMVGASVAEAAIRTALNIPH